uniref:WAP domain-containing protein n=1 Tax=Octopus bimaculoides TaxID=37653 RepID=A0A0L8IFG7_OCTBM
MVKNTLPFLGFLLLQGVIVDSSADAGCFAAEFCLINFFRCARNSEMNCCIIYRSCMRDECGVENLSCNYPFGKRGNYDKRSRWGEIISSSKWRMR